MNVGIYWCLSLHRYWNEYYDDSLIYNSTILSSDRLEITSNVGNYRVAYCKFQNFNISSAVRLNSGKNNRTLIEDSFFIDCGLFQKVKPGNGGCALYVGVEGIIAVNRLCFVGTTGNTTDLHCNLYSAYNKPQYIPLRVNLTSAVNGRSSGNSAFSMYGGMVNFNNKNLTNNMALSNPGVRLVSAYNISKFSYNTILNNTNSNKAAISATFYISTTINGTVYINFTNNIQNEDQNCFYLNALQQIYIDSCSFSENNYTIFVNINSPQKYQSVLISNTYIDDFKPCSGTYALNFESNLTSYTNFPAPIVVNGDGVQVRKTHIYAEAKNFNDNAFAYGIIALYSFSSYN
ncbi:hypothetical protein TVAG_380260 [Trichomonas vaginalis G3]|uniref:Uncharacterized protein n=1 Tax=Trichomonas vaginalis (strain ATCC PRA-98 / G3) TaxID=412133 RepID=A2DXG4_TRIV3|nr:hypothetical protein TVAGG3_0925210 [Trichomonas vaginalis G3]EAY14916.1 hypothetical protein TVAG_380260 [Trichomonas vaginalis G3]KAI5485416.1 hypothetical protein TVAGG3_0925210 [Trichomonas vaginalis G3]|eukprot:XP_001327139.1 hypothetical protein [Trichomonas vaginalis G3]